MKYTLGYNERSPDVLMSDGADAQRINLAAFAGAADDASASAGLQAVLEVIRGRWAEGDAVVTSNEPLNRDLRAALRRGAVPDAAQYARINALVAAYTRGFRTGPKAEIEWLPCDGPRPAAWEPCTLYGRYGNVEMRVIENWLQNRDGLLTECRTIAGHLGDEAYMYRGPASRHWLSSDDINYNLRILMTNAGFYPGADGGADDLACWAEKYLASLAASKYLFSYPAAYPNYFATQGHLFSEGGILNEYGIFPDPAVFYRMLGGHDVLFVSAFAGQINRLYASQKLFSLYTDIVIPPFKLTALDAHISTYPNRPHGSWRETYQLMLASIDAAFREKRFTLFFAACGCYGMPLCRYVYKRYGCTAVYFGNHLNTLFGVRMACNDDFLSDRRNHANWASSNLGAVRNMDKIDAGRYV